MQTAETPFANVLRTLAVARLSLGRLGIQHVWMQPGAESEQAVHRAEALGMNVIANGPCALVVLEFGQ